MSDVVEKVVRLIALASSDNEGEARNAAIKACALIREHKLLVLDAGDVKESEWVQDLREERSTGGPTVHISSDGRRGLCGAYMGHGVNYFWLDKVPSLRNCCSECVREFIGSRRRRR